ISALGAARALISDRGRHAIILRVQSELFTVGAELATDAAEYSTLQRHFKVVTADFTTRCEEEIADLERRIALPDAFVIPGGPHSCSASSHSSRTQGSASRLTASARPSRAAAPPSRPSAHAAWPRISGSVSIRARERAGTERRSATLPSAMPTLRSKPDRRVRQTAL